MTTCLFTGGPAVITALGFAIKTEVYDGRDDDCVFRYCAHRFAE